MSYNLKSIRKDFQKNGVFYTPDKLAIIMKQYISVDYKNVYDPTCGDGSLLKHFDDKIEKFGQELDNTQLEIAKYNLNNFTGVCGDTLNHPGFINKKFDLIMANPPFSIKYNPEFLLKDERFTIAPVFPPSSKADYAFILHILHFLSEKGQAICLNFPGILYRGYKEAQIRKFLIQKNYIDRIIQIPANYFIDTKISTILIIFKKNKLTKDIIFEDLELDMIRSVTVDEIQSKDYNLSVSQYLQREILKENIDPLKLENKVQKLIIENLIKNLERSYIISQLNNTNISIKTFIDDIEIAVNKFKLDINLTK